MSRLSRAVVAGALSALALFGLAAATQTVCTDAPAVTVADGDETPATPRNIDWP